MGEATLAELWDDFCRQKDFEDPLLVPAKKGVYCIRIPAGMEVAFKDTIDNHPGAAYPIERLEAKRVPSSGILYIGKANGEKGLFQRLRQYLRYGFDAGSNHRGGRAIFQVEGHENLICRWCVCENCEDKERLLLENFKRKYGAYPIANWRK